MRQPLYFYEIVCEGSQASIVLKQGTNAKNNIFFLFVCLYHDTRRVIL